MADGQDEIQKVTWYNNEPNFLPIFILILLFGMAITAVIKICT